MLSTHTIICSSNPQRPRGGSGCGGVSTITAIQTRSVRTPTDRKILQTTLSKHNSKTQIPIHDIVSGVYHYEIQFGTEDKVRGKLHIIK
jgi:hypothetical protein